MQRFKFFFCLIWVWIILCCSVYSQKGASLLSGLWCTVEHCGEYILLQLLVSYQRHCSIQWLLGKFFFVVGNVRQLGNFVSRKFYEHFRWMAPSLPRARWFGCFSSKFLIWGRTFGCFRILSRKDTFWAQRQPLPRARHSSWSRCKMGLWPDLHGRRSENREPTDIQLDEILWKILSAVEEQDFFLVQSFSWFRSSSRDWYFCHKAEVHHFWPEHFSLASRGSSASWVSQSSTKFQHGSFRGKCSCPHLQNMMNVNISRINLVCFRHVTKRNLAQASYMEVAQRATWDWWKIAIRQYHVPISKTRHAVNVKSLAKKYYWGPGKFAVIPSQEMESY